MPINPINHYSITNPATVYDEEAMTALELAARTAAKVNEAVELVNQNEANTQEMIESLPGQVNEAIEEHFENGSFDEQIAAHTAELVEQMTAHKEELEQTVNQETDQLEARLDNLLGSMTEGGTTSDGELLDMRVGFDGATHVNAGTALRKQIGDFHPRISFNGYFLEIDTTTKTAKLSNNAGRMNLGWPTRNGGKVYSIYPTPLELSYDGDINIGLWLNLTDTEHPTFFAASVRSGVYTPNTGDILLCSIYNNNINPYSLSPADIKVNGKQMFAPFLGNRRYAYSQMFIPHKPMIVDYKNKVFILQKGYYSVPFYEAGVFELTEDIKVTFGRHSVVQYLRFRHTTKVLDIAGRTSAFREYDLCLGTLYDGKFTPVEMPGECVQYGNEKAELGTGHMYMQDFFAPMHAATADNPFRITLIGDSITYGAHGTGCANDTTSVIMTTDSKNYYRNTLGYCWANMFKNYIEDNYNALVTNNGISGFDSHTVNLHKVELVPADTDLVIMTIGTNNRDNGTDKQNAIDQYYNDMREIIDYCHKLHIPVLLCAPIQADASNEDRADKNYPVHIFQLNGVVQRLGSDYDMEIANVHNEMYFYCMDNGIDMDSLLDDHLHPNDDGYRVLFYRYLKAFGLCPHYKPVA